MSGGPIKSTTLHFLEYLENYQRYLNDFLRTSRPVYILNMSIHTSFSSNFISHSGAIWQIVTTRIKTGLYSRITRKPSWRKVSARQQCVYEGPYRRNLSLAGNPTLEPNIVSLMLYTTAM